MTTNTSNTLPVVFADMAKSISTSNAKTGSSGARVMRAKEWKECNKVFLEGVSNKAAKRAYMNYYKDAIEANVGSLAAGLTSGNYGVEGYRLNKAGTKLNVTFIDKSKLAGNERESMEEQICAMPLAEREQFVLRLQALLEADKE